MQESTAGTGTGRYARTKRYAMNDPGRIMFEIYKTGDEPVGYRVVYFTELDETQRDAEIDRALDGDHVFDGFIDEPRAVEAKTAIAALVDRLNAGTPLSSADIDALLKPYVVA